MRTVYAFDKNVLKCLLEIPWVPGNVLDAGEIARNRPSWSVTQNKKTVSNVRKEKILANY